MKRSFWYQSWIACVLLLSANVTLWGQGATATVTGTVSDPTGAVLPKAQVTITNTETNVKYAGVTNGSGQYTVSLLPPGSYRVQAEAQGFKAERVVGIILQVNQNLKLDFKLQTGQASQTVEVYSAVQDLQTQSASVGAVIANTQIVELPLNGRQYYSLAYLTPATYPPVNNSTLSFRGGFNVAGSSEVENNYRLDGFNNNDPATSSPAFLPSVDAIQEFNLLTGVYSAQYGVMAGGQLLVVTKSGTNAFHGTAFEYTRNQIFDAKDFFTEPGITPSFVRNEFGGTLGGPIVKDRFFGFASYEGLRLRQEITALGTVPTPQMAAGDFSAFLAPGPNHVQLVNPLTRAPIAGNIITAANGLSPIGAALAALYPSETPDLATPAGSLPADNYSFNEDRIENMNEIEVRFDYTLDPSNSVYVTVGHQTDPSFEPSNSLCGARVLPGFGCHVGATGDIAGVGYTHIFSPALIANTLISWNQFGQPRVQQDVTNNFVGDNNIPGVFLGGNLPNNTGIPAVEVSGYSTLGGGTNLPQGREDDSYQASENVTYTHGPHTFSMGGQYNRFLYSLYYVADGRGEFIFNGSAGAPTSGNVFADLLFGTPDITIRNPYAPTNHPRQMFWNGYVQDDWKVTSRLTVNLGLRYEYFGTVADKDNRYSSFDPAGAGVMQVSDATTLGFPEHLWLTQKDNFGPRIGFSLQLPPDYKTVLRGGFGYFYDNATAGNGFLGLGLNPPIREPEEYDASDATPIQLSNPYPSTINGATTITPTGVVPHLKTPLATEWSLGLQRQITPTLLADITYFGTKGTYLPLGYNNNQPPPTTLSEAQVNALRPFPTYGNTDYINSVGNSSFNSLQAKLTQRYHNGLVFIAAFTWAHSIDEGVGIATGDSGSSAPQNAYDLAAERGSSDFNIDDHFAFSPVYELPFGKGRQYLKHGVSNVLAGGWQITGIYTVQTGLPFTVYYSTNNSNTFNNHDRPNQIANPNNGPKTVSKWFNTSAFVNPGFGQFGDARRNSVLGPGYDDLDFSASRFFPVIPDRVKAEFRAEMFNIFNHPDFAQPNAYANEPNFGEITSTVNGPDEGDTARQIEFALRLTF